MDSITGVINAELTMLTEVHKCIGSVIRLKGVIHKIREMSGFAFVIIRTGRDLIQCVYSKEFSQFELGNIAEGYAVCLTGKTISDGRATNGFEIHLLQVEILSKPAAELPIVINKKKLDIKKDRGNKQCRNYLYVSFEQIF